MVRKEKNGEESELPRQLSLEMWGNTYTRQVTDAKQRRGETTLRILDEMGDEPRIEDFSSMSEYVDAKERYDREFQRRLDYELREKPLQKAEEAAIRGTDLGGESTRKTVFERDKGVCQVCGEKLDWDNYECGHIVDRCVGGSDRLTNLVAMCARCNALKPDHTSRAEFDEWVKRGGPLGDKSEGLSVTTSARRSHAKRGMHKRIERGLHPCRWPYGYRPVRDDHGKVIGAEIVPEEAEAVRLIAELYLSGMGFGRVTVAMNESPYRPANGGEWRTSTIGNTIRNPTYAGYPAHGDVVSEERSDKYEAIWDEQTWRAILRERERRRTYRGGRPTASPCSGLVYCARCCYRMPIVKNGAGTRYFRCFAHPRRKLYGPCHSNYIRMDEVEHVVERHIVELLRPEVAAVRLESAEPEAARLSLELEKARKLAERRQAELSRAFQLLTEGATDQATYDDVRSGLERRRDAALARVEEIERQINLLPDPAEQAAYLDTVAGAVPMLPHLEPGWLRLAGDIEQVRAALDQAGIKVWVEEGEILWIEPEF